MSATSALSGISMIVRRSLRQHALSTTVTVLSAALGCGLVMAVFSVSQQSREAFAGGSVGYDAVLGARGSQLQLVLNTVFHLETSPGNIPWTMYEQIAEDPFVDLAVPYAIGDNFRGFRIVGTSTDIFDRFEYARGEHFKIAHGNTFEANRREAVLGATAARECGLWPGMEFEPFHGLIFNEKAERHQAFTVVGVLEPTNTPSDRVIWIPIEGVFRMSGHVLRGSGERYEPTEGESIAAEHKELSAVMLKFQDPRVGVKLSHTINKQGKAATLAWPIDRVILELFNKMGWVSRILELVAYMTLLVVSGSILASLYNTMNERRREFAILRALGARRRTVFCAIVLESTAIAGLGAFCGFAVYAGVLAVAAALVREQTGVLLDVLAWHPALFWTPVGMILLGAASGLLPAVKAYSTDVASNLIPAS